MWIWLVLAVLAVALTIERVVPLLTLITLRKCVDRVEYFRAGRRDAAREATAGEGDGRPDPWLAALDREPQPEEAVILAETVEHLFRDLDAHERPILELSLQGYTAPEISTLLGRAERSVRIFRRGNGAINGHPRRRRLAHLRQHASSSVIGLGFRHTYPPPVNASCLPYRVFQLRKQGAQQVAQVLIT